MSLKEPIYPGYSTELDFEDIARRSAGFARHIDENRDRVVDTLLGYETYEVAMDEIERSTDLLLHLRENRDYFQRQVGPVASFLPSNQPLYALTSFAIVPSLMASEAHVKAPSGMRRLFPNLVQALDVKGHFPNLHVHQGAREDFINKRAAFKRDSNSGEVQTATDVVIFTGTPEKATEMRREFHKRILFIANGAGHNPIVVAKDADIQKAVMSALRVQLYNQGQDCAAPNSILVHEDVYDEFIRQLSVAVREVRVGAYQDRENTVGPINKIGDLTRIHQLMVAHAAYISTATEGVIRARSAIVEPTIIEKPLKEGGNFTEQFAPIFFVQKYQGDSQLADYFKDPRYKKNAMYITLFGHSPYVDTLVGNPDANPEVVHDESTIIRNTDLHAPGIERGTKPYGGYGRGASSITINGNTIAKPTLPQRDIFEYLVKPFLEKEDKEIRVDASDKVIPMKSRVPRCKERQEEQWIASIVDDILKKFPDKKQYVVAAGASPRGPIHFGSMRDVMVSSIVSQALRERGKDTQLIFSWDDFEQLQDVPPGIDPALEKYIGVPLSAIPDPFGRTTSYARHFELEFEDVMRELGVDMVFQSQTDVYKTGKNDGLILEALKRRHEYAEVALNSMTEASRIRGMINPDEFRESYYPIIVYSRFTGKANTTVLNFDGDSSITYRCNDTGKIETVDLTQEHIVKLKWKVEWPLRWKSHDIVFEAGGVNQSIPGGSYETAVTISKEMLENRVPVYQRYGTVTLRHAHDTLLGSGQSETSISRLLEVYEPAIIKWLYARKKPQQNFSIGFDREVLQQYDEYDRNVSTVKDTIPFNQVVALGQIVDWNEDRFAELLSVLGKEFDAASIHSRLRRARTWVDKYSPEDAIQLLGQPNEAYIETLDIASKERIRKLRNTLLHSSSSIGELEAMTCLVPDVELSDRANRDSQRAFYTNIYQLIIGRNTGPKISTLLWTMDREAVLRLLNI